MKITDIHAAIKKHKQENNITHNFKDDKYILLELGNEIYSLDIVDVSREAIWLKIKEDENKKEMRK